MGTGSAFQFKKLQANVETRRGNKETLQSMCKAPSPPTSPPTQATAFANIAQHWLDKHKKNNKINRKYIKIVKKCRKSLQKRSKNLADPPQSDQTSPEPDKRLKSYPQSCESSPKVSRRRPQGSPNGPKRHQKASKKHPGRYPETRPEPNPEPETPFFSECL